LNRRVRICSGEETVGPVGQEKAAARAAARAEARAETRVAAGGRVEKGRLLPDRAGIVSARRAVIGKSTLPGRRALHENARNAVPA
jgi:hypothetical protein